MTVLISVLFALLVTAGLLCVARLWRGRSLADRIVALDTLLVVVVCGIAVDAVRRESGVFLDVAVVAALLGFTGTSLVARFIERRGAR